MGLPQTYMPAPYELAQDQYAFELWKNQGDDNDPAYRYLMNAFRVAARDELSEHTSWRITIIDSPWRRSLSSSASTNQPCPVPSSGLNNDCNEFYATLTHVCLITLKEV